MWAGGVEMLGKVELGGLEASIKAYNRDEYTTGPAGCGQTLNTASSFAFQGRWPRVMWKTLRERQVMEIQGILGEAGNSAAAQPGLSNAERVMKHPLYPQGL